MPEDRRPNEKFLLEQESVEEAGPHHRSPEAARSSAIEVRGQGSGNEVTTKRAYLRAGNRLLW